MIRDTNYLSSEDCQHVILLSVADAEFEENEGGWALLEIVFINNCWLGCHISKLKYILACPIKPM